jgi:hypothetical protein
MKGKNGGDEGGSTLGRVSEPTHPKYSDLMNICSIVWKTKRNSFNIPIKSTKRAGG